MSARGPAWSRRIEAAEVARAPGARLRVRLEASEAERAQLARLLDAITVHALEADADITPWRDGLDVRATWRARLTRACGISLEPFEEDLTGAFEVRAAPPGGEGETGETEIDLDPEADDPPDEMEAGGIDLAAYVVEHVILDLDPHPRKPGAVFEPPAPDAELSPFAALKALRPPASDA